MGVWKLLTADKVVVEEATGRVRRMLSSVSVDRVFDRRFWKRLVGFVEIETDGDVIPVRGRYDPARQGWQIGVNTVAPGHRQWISLADAVASTLLSGHPPKVLRAITLAPRGRLRGLRTVALGGAIPVDPARTDFFKTVIERRVAHTSDVSSDPVERKRLDRFLKTLGSATSYGIFAQENRRVLPARERERVRVYRPSRAFEAWTGAPEDPGRYFFPPIATAITGAARLMLALLERSVRDAGGTYTMADTDSFAIVASAAGRAGGAIPELRWDDVDAICRRFLRLSPYDPAIVTELLKLESENFDDRGAPRRLECLAISAKRYALFDRRELAQGRLAKFSEHGLGHLLDPLGAEDAREWMREVWLYLIRSELGQRARKPQWFARPAVGEVSVSSPAMLRPFAAFNKGKSYEEQIKPFNFALAAHLAPFGAPSGRDPERFQLVAPYERDASRWLDCHWIDRYTGREYAIVTEGHAGGVGFARVKSIGDVVAQYRAHPEAKSLGPNGERCGPNTRGLLHRRLVTVGRRHLIGKEANELDERGAGLYHSIDEVVAGFDKGASSEGFLAALRAVPTTDLVRATGRDRSTVKRWKSGESRPRRHEVEILRRYVERAARAQNRERGAAPERGEVSKGVRHPRARTRAHRARAEDRLACVG